MRRALAFSLLLLFSFTLIGPLFASDDESNLPACCRRNGKHHCMMRMMEESHRTEPGFNSLSEKCPCCPFNTGQTRCATFYPESACLYFAEIRRHPASFAQVEARYRLSFDRNRQKRGPPFLSLAA